MRLQVFLSGSGVCSRRKALDHILSGKVTVNGQKISEPSFSVDPLRDRVVFEGRALAAREKTYILLNKPKGVITTVKDRFAHKTVLDLLPQNLRFVFPVGRLDKDTTGLLLLTNDGPLAHCLTHPSFEVTKTYRVVLDKTVREEDRKKLEKGVMLEGKKTHPCLIKKISSDELEMTIHEGRKRQVRRMFSLLRYHVVDLSRIRQGILTLGELGLGQWRLLAPAEVDKLRLALKMD